MYYFDYIKIHKEQKKLFKGDNKMTALSKALQDVEKFYDIKKAENVHVDFNAVSVIRFSSEGEWFFVIIAPTHNEKR